ncbi:MAG TPA: M20 family metallopeptidase [Bacillota bacterium]|jgi:hippurate hydrolase|nr:M20 family metallopeptidase [Bacillota bacterium]
MIELLKKYRRDLHQIPELGYKEFKTQKYLLDTLGKYPCEITEFSPTGICAFFPAKSPKYSGTVAFRSDIDGISVEESNPFSHRSKHEGLMHACGHDGHMAMLLGLAKKISEMRQELTANVLLIFQPAEESPGGAEAIAESGVFKKYDVRRIFAFHMGPSDLPGVIMARPLEMMARSAELTVAVLGRSAHIAYPHRGIDALRIACLYLDSLYKEEADLFPPEEYRLLKFGQMTAGTARNVIADKALLFGTLRSFRDETFDLLLETIHSIADHFEKDYGCTIEISNGRSYPAIFNDPELFGLAKEALSPNVFPSIPEFITLRKPLMTSDDFSYYLRKVPGLYMFLGTGNRKPLHSGDFDFDEEVLEVGVEAYLRLLRLPL